MYRFILGLAALALFTRFIWLLRSGRWNLGQFTNKIINEISSSFKDIGEFSLKRDALFAVLRNIFYGLTVLFFLVLAVTGFIPVLVFDSHLSSLLLIIHVTIAPFFVFSLTASLLLRAHQQQYSSNDFIYLQSRLNKEEVQNLHAVRFWEKTYFWLFAVFSLPAVLSILISMYPLFGTDGQILLLDIHRYSVLVLFVTASFFVLSRYRLKSNEVTADQTAAK